MEVRVAQGGDGEEFLHGVQEFCLLSVGRESMVHLEERRRGYAGSVSLGAQCISWLVSMMEVALQNLGVKDFVKSFQEDSKVLMVRRGDNRAVLGVGSMQREARKGLFCYQKGGDEARCWQLGIVLTYCKAKIGSPAFGCPSSVGKKSEKKVGPGFPPAVLLAKAGALMLGEGSDETLGKDQLGNPLGKSSDFQQGSSARGNVECVDGLVLSTRGDCDATVEGDGRLKAEDGRGKGRRAPGVGRGRSTF
jgi:hypothetical protein